MNWLIERDENFKPEQLSDEQILQSIQFIENKIEYLYHKELVRLEKLKAKAIIKDLEQFRNFQEKYYSTKSIAPDVWLETWEIYRGILNEAEKRNLLIRTNNY